ncbi:MAG: hypothetical protein QNJ63_12180 [Calothrix sp. MO_192.B10]|nr:hypothetical protein [Calothrix sp. MO_192.B10]
MSVRDLSAYHKLQAPPTALGLQIALHLEQILLLGWGLIPLGYLIKWKWLRKRQRNLLDEIDKYNAVVKAVEIKQELIAAGNEDISFTDQEKLMTTLQNTRENLVGALKTEHILRKNRAFLARNQELLASSLTPVQALQIQAEGSEYTKLLNEALQLSQDVQDEMMK